jgi:hypothetical protein
MWGAMFLLFSSLRADNNLNHNFISNDYDQHFTFSCNHHNVRVHDGDHLPGQCCGDILANLKRQRGQPMQLCLGTTGPLRGWQRPRAAGFSPCSTADQWILFSVGPNLYANDQYGTRFPDSQ